MNTFISVLKEDSPLHKHKKYEVIVYTKGNGSATVSDKTFDVGPGKITIIPPQTAHGSSKFSQELERIYINGDFNHISIVNSPVVISDNSDNEGTKLAKMIYDNRYSKPEYVMALINAFEHFLLQSIKMENDIFLAVDHIIETISNDFSDSSLNLNTLLNESGYSEDYIRAQFKKITRKTPNEFLTKVRINHACYLIDLYKETFPLSYVAEKCGYSDYVYFSRKFKQIMKVSPREYMNTT